MSRRSRGDNEDQVLLPLEGIERIDAKAIIRREPPDVRTEVLPPSSKPEPIISSTQETETFFGLNFKRDPRVFYYNRTSNVPPESPVKQVLRETLFRLAKKATKAAIAGSTLVGVMTTPIGEDPPSPFPAKQENQLELFDGEPWSAVVRPEPGVEMRHR